MAENATIPTREEIAALPRWAQVAFAARCARRVQPLFRHFWPKAPAQHVQSLSRAISVAETAAAVAAATDHHVEAYSYAADAAYAARADAADDAAAAADAAYVTYVAYAYAAYSYTVDASYIDAAAATAAAARTAARTATSCAIRFDFDTLRERAAVENWTDDTPVPPTAFGPMWPFGVPKDWPQENAGDRLTVTLAPPPDATAEQIADFQIRLYEALNKLAIANGGAGLKVDSLGRDVSALVPVGKGE